MKNFLLLVTCAVLAGCATADRFAHTGIPELDESRALEKSGVPHREIYGPKVVEIEVTTIPPGAAIEVNNNYVGNAPCKIPVTVVKYLNFWGLDGPTRVVALPMNDGEYVQTKYLTGQVPQRLLFNMNLRYVKEIDVRSR